ncbi:phage capsid protein [Magnetospirillum sulfuroxidans]|uniref:Phage major capsid protein n=1 Tax=Magnetospirillum sulfuroxidans TaxID=611300 RepID=A0ABS5I8P8_9PROT|nr:phage capsid protein [Magnetospirillum sulfuroxidans]MBR9970813.1 hypothetical protein [Magnetospirillum sulfuroxidans]
MSTNSIDVAFIKQYEKEVHLAYQRDGSKLRNTVRTKNGVIGATATFQKISKGTATTKARNGKIPRLNLDHSNVECTLEDHYALYTIDKLDEIKTNIDEKAATQTSAVNALGRKTDEILISVLDSSANYAQDGTTGLTLDKVLTAFEMLGNADVPDDGERYAWVGYRQWSQLLQIDEFSDADYVGADDLPWKGIQAKRWLGTMWMPHSGLSKSSNIRRCYWYHKSAIGHAIGADVQTSMQEIFDEASTGVRAMMSQGACLIDAAGVVSMRCLES